MEEEKNITEAEILKVKGYVSENRWEQIFDFAETMREELPGNTYDVFLTIKRSYNDVKERILKNTISFEHGQLELSKITDRVLELLNDIEKEAAQEKRDQLRYGITGVSLVLLILFVQTFFSRENTQDLPPLTVENYKGAWLLKWQNCEEGKTEETFMLNLLQSGKTLLGRGEQIAGGKDVFFNGTIEADDKLNLKLTRPGIKEDELINAVTLSFNREQFRFTGEVPGRTPNCTAEITMQKPE